jgi:hypothetical protein
VQIQLFLDQLVPREHKAFKVLKELLDQLVHRECKALQVILAYKDKQDRLDLRVQILLLQVLSALQALQEHKE